MVDWESSSGCWRQTVATISSVKEKSGTLLNINKLSGSKCLGPPDSITFISTSQKPFNWKYPFLSCPSSSCLLTKNHAEPDENGQQMSWQPNEVFVRPAFAAMNSVIVMRHRKLKYKKKNNVKSWFSKALLHFLQVSVIDYWHLRVWHIINRPHDPHMWHGLWGL